MTPKKFSTHIFKLSIVFTVFIFSLEFLSFILVQMGYPPQAKSQRVNKNMLFKKTKGSHQLEIDHNPPVEYSVENRSLPPEKEDLNCNWSNLFQRLSNNYPQLNKNVSARHNCYKDDNLIFDVIYNIDSWGHRKVVSSDHDFKSHLLTVGCSIIFGQGLSEKQTLASFLQTYWTESKVYNPSRPGGSVADFIISTEHFNHWNHFEPKRGLALIYFSPKIHIPRLYPFLDQMIRWNELGAALVWSENDQKYVWKGVWKDYLWWFPLVRVLRKSWLIHTFGLDIYFSKIGEHHYEGYAKALRQLKNNYSKIYPESDFVVFTKPSEKIPQSFFDHLDSFGIHYLYYGEISKKQFPIEYMEIPFDSHPSEDWNRIFSNIITRDLNRPLNQKVLKNFFKEN